MEIPAVEESVRKLTQYTGINFDANKIDTLKNLTLDNNSRWVICAKSFYFSGRTAYGDWWFGGDNQSSKYITTFEIKKAEEDIRVQRIMNHEDKGSTPEEAVKITLGVLVHMIENPNAGLILDMPNQKKERWNVPL